MSILALYLSVCVLVNQQEKSSTAPPRPIPIFLQRTLDQARAGDIYAMIEVNAWDINCGRSPSFAKENIRPKLEAQAKAGNPKAMLALAAALRSDRPSRSEPQRSRDLIRQAALMGSGEGMVEHAAAVWRHEKDKEEAIKWWLLGKEALERRANQGEMDAILQLAYLYPLPQLNDKRLRNQEIYEQRLGWMRKAAEKGNPSAMYSLAGEIDNGLHDPDSWIWMEKAAQTGKWEAMTFLGYCYAFTFPEDSKPAPSKVSGVKRASKMLSDKSNQPVWAKHDVTKAWEWWDKAISLVGEEKVMSLLPEELPERPKKP